MRAGLIAVGVALAAGVGGGLVLSGAKRWNDGQATIDVVAGAAADTTGVTSFSRGLWGRDPVTGQEVALTPEAGTYELIVGASSISMLVGMPFANGLRGPTTRIPERVDERASRNPLPSRIIPRGVDAAASPAMLDMPSTPWKPAVEARSRRVLRLSGDDVLAETIHGFPLVVPAAQTVGRSGRVYAVEANHVVFTYLLKSVYWSGYPDVIHASNCAAVNPESHGTTLPFAFDP